MADGRTEISSGAMAESAVSWAAVIAGGVTAAALTLALLAFGAGMGFSSVSPWPSSGISAGTFKIAAGIYLIVVAMVASTIGGYMAGRLRSKWIGLHSEEVLFRDTAHGFLAWAAATVFGAAALARREGRMHISSICCSARSRVFNRPLRRSRATRLPCAPRRCAFLSAACAKAARCRPPTAVIWRRSSRRGPG